MKSVLGLSMHRQINYVHQTASTGVHTGTLLRRQERIGRLLWQGRGFPLQVAAHARLGRNTAPVATRVAVPSHHDALQPTPRVPAARTLAVPQGVKGYLSSLNAEQEAAAKSSCDVVRVKAGPGSGKTRVITARVAWLIAECGVQPGHILTITFTRKAAGELKERLSKVLGRDSETVKAGTFHAICSQIVRKHVKRLNNGLTRTFTVKDDDETEDIMQKVVLDSPALQACNLNKEQQGRVAQWLRAEVSRLKNSWSTVHGVEDLGQEWTWDDGRKRVSLKPHVVNSVFHAYHRSLRAVNAVDYDDLLGLAVYVLKTCPDILGYYRSRYHHILVDEFQDTNTPQYHFVKYLRGNHNSLFVVGDPDQAIYGWRGANPRVMEEWLPTDYPQSKLFYLSSNYRSVREVVEASSAVLSYGGLPKLYKPMKPMRGSGDYVHTVQLRDCDTEARWVADRARWLVDKEGYKPSDIAVLYRMNVLSKKPVSALNAAGFRTRVVGEVDFWRREEVKDMLAYLTWALNPYDNMALERVLAKPARGIGDKTLEALRETATERMTWADVVFGDLEKECLTLDQLHKAKAGDASVFNITSAEEILAKHGIRLSSKAVEGLNNLRCLLVILRSCACHMEVKDMISVVLVTGAYATYLQAKDKDINNVGVLRNMAANTAEWLQQEDDASDTDMPEEDSSSVGSSTDEGVTDANSSSTTKGNGSQAAAVRPSGHAASPSSITGQVARLQLSAEPAGSTKSGSIASTANAASTQDSTQAASTSDAPAGSASTGNTTASTSIPMGGSSQAASPNSSGSTSPDSSSTEESLAQGLDRLSQFLQHIKLVTDTEQSKPGDVDAVQLMSVHSSKGLEFKAVFVLGLEEGIMPTYEGSEKGEEKRVAYVGCTRAKDQLYLLYTQRRCTYGKYISRKESCYLTHLRAVEPGVLKHVSTCQPTAGAPTAQAPPARASARLRQRRRASVSV